LLFLEYFVCVGRGIVLGGTVRREVLFSDLKSEDLLAELLSGQLPELAILCAAARLKCICIESLSVASLVRTSADTMFALRSEVDYQKQARAREKKERDQEREHERQKLAAAMKRIRELENI
jgi:hypothetical protein